MDTHLFLIHFSCFGSSFWSIWRVLPSWTMQIRLCVKLCQNCDLRWKQNVSCRTSSEKKNNWKVGPGAISRISKSKSILNISKYTPKNLKKWICLKLMHESITIPNLVWLFFTTASARLNKIPSKSEVVHDFPSEDKSPNLVVGPLPNGLNGV